MKTSDSLGVMCYQILFFCVVFGYAYFGTSHSWGFHSIWVALNIQIISFFTYTPSITRAQCDHVLWGNLTVVTSGYKCDLQLWDQGGFFPEGLPAPLHLQTAAWNFSYAMIPNAGPWQSFHLFGGKCSCKGQCSKSFLNQNLFCVKVCPSKLRPPSFLVLRFPLFYELMATEFLVNIL